MEISLRAAEDGRLLCRFIGSGARLVHSRGAPGADANTA
jgi:hypothetical protein